MLTSGLAEATSGLEHMSLRGLVLTLLIAATLVLTLARCSEPADPLAVDPSPASR